MDFNISIFLDKRLLIKNSKDLYRVKLRVYSNITKKAKLYSTKIELSIEDFEKIYGSTIKVKKKLSEIKSHLSKFEEKAIDVCKELDPFTFEKLRKSSLEIKMRQLM